VCGALAASLVLVATAGGASAGKPRDKRLTAQEWADSLKQVPVRGATLAVLDVGRGEPVVFVHGFAADYRSWVNQVQPFAAGHRVIAYSRRYHFPNAGGGDGRDYGDALHEQDLLAVLDALGVREATLVGHDDGGAIVARFAADHPDRVRALVLVEPTLPDLLKGTAQEGEWQSGWLVANERAKQSLVSDFTELGLVAIAEWRYGNDLEMRVPKPVLRRFADNAASVHAAVLSTAKRTPFGADRARAVRCPVLVIDGAKSPWHARAIADAFAAARPGTQRATIRGAGHGPMWDDASAFDRVVQPFVDRPVAGE
jgi:pimeloyl-ACP methyl ester carboxylesterase